MFWIENKSLSMAFYKDLCICLEELSMEGKHQVRDTKANVQRVEVGEGIGNLYIPHLQIPPLGFRHTVLCFIIIFVCICLKT